MSDRQGKSMFPLASFRHKLGEPDGYIVDSITVSLPIMIHENTREYSECDRPSPGIKFFNYSYRNSANKCPLEVFYREVLYYTSPLFQIDPTRQSR